MLKSNLTAYFCYATWSSPNIYYIKDKFVETCKEVGLRFELVNVDTEEGATFSVKHKFRNVPMLIVMDKNGKEVLRKGGNNCFVSLLKFM